MLVLARKTSETICVGDSVRITVVQIRPGRVRLGIEAPSSVRIRREEIVADVEAITDPDCEIEIAAGAA